MTIQDLMFLLVVFVANIFEAMTGFAGTLLAMPASMMLIGLYEAKTVLNIIALITCSTIAIMYIKDVNQKEFIKIISFMLLGMAGGLVLFESLSSSLLLNIYALFIILIALKNLIISRELRPLPILVQILLITLAGVIHGMFLSGGSLLVLYAMISLKGKAEFRATLAAVWVVLDMLLLLNQFRMGYVTMDLLKLTLYVLPLLVLAIILGNYFHHFIKQATFTMITYVLLLISGISLLIY